MGNFSLNTSGELDWGGRLQLAAPFLAGVLTAGAIFAIAVGVGAAAGAASDAATGAVYDLASGKSPTWESVGTDALYGAIGGAVGEAAGRLLGGGIKAAARGVGTGLVRSVIAAGEGQSGRRLGSFSLAVF